MRKTKTSIFQHKQIRKTINNGKWFFVIKDVIYVLTDTKDPKNYIKKMKKRYVKLATEWGKIAYLLPIETAGGVQKTNCANRKGLIRIMESMPSPRTRPFTKWLAEHQLKQDDQ